MKKTFNERVEEAQQVISSLTPQSAAVLKNNNNVVFVDPRPSSAIVATGIIEGARQIQLDDITAGFLPGDMDKHVNHIITACEGGPMGAIAAHEFKKQGFTNVNYVQGGTRAWMEAGLPTGI